MIDEIDWEFVYSKPSQKLYFTAVEYLQLSNFFLLITMCSDLGPYRYIDIIDVFVDFVIFSN